jgi:hypothetical protein
MVWVPLMNALMGDWSQHYAVAPKNPIDRKEAAFALCSPGKLARRLLL